MFEAASGSGHILDETGRGVIAGKKFRIASFVRWAGTLALVGWLLTLIDFQETFETLAETRVVLIPIVLIVLLVIRLLMAWRWLYVLKKLGVEAGFLDVFRITMVSIALSLVMPGGHAAVDAYRTWSMSQLRGSVARVTASVIADRVFGFYSFTLLAFLAVLVLPDIPGDVDWVPIISLIFAVSTAATGALLFFGPGLLEQSGRLFFWWPKAQNGLRRVSAQLKDGNVLRRIAVPSTMMALPVQMLRGVYFYLVYKAIGAGVGLLFMMLYAPIVFILLLLPISVAGVGLREGSMYFLLAPHGVSVDAVVAAGILSHILGVMMGLPGALWITRKPAQAKEGEDVGE